MALLQIAEPGRAAAPHQHRLAVGIDLGTTNSLVATVRSGVPTVLADAAGPCCPRWCTTAPTDGQRRRRERACGQADDPRNTIASAKRLIGRSWPTCAPAHPLPLSWRPVGQRRRCASRGTA
jgi:molecular chaperone HscA